MAVRLALYIRGLAAVNYQTLRLVVLNYLGIPSSGLQTIVELVTEVEFGNLPFCLCIVPLRLSHSECI